MFKMSELVKLTNTPKSTILYYVKEGLLNEPKKPKPNLHLYDECAVGQLGFIKYLQENFNSSIAELKALFAHPKFNINSPYSSLLNVLDIVMGADFTTSFTKKELSWELKVAEDKIDELEKKGLIFKRDELFTQKEKQMLEVILNCDTKELSLIREYAKSAKKMADIEIKLGLNRAKKDDKNLKHFFDIVLLLKPYIFNMQTLKTYQEETKDEKVI